MKRGLPWFPVSVDLPHNPKVLRFADATGLGVQHAIGHLACLWAWFAREQANGTLLGHSAESARKFHGSSTEVPRKFQGDAAESARKILATALGIHEEAVGAMISTGWLDVIEDGLRVHDWEEHAGKLIEKAEKDRGRKQQKASTVTTSKGDHSVEIPRNVRENSERIPRLDGDGDGDISKRNTAGADAPRGMVQDHGIGQDHVSSATCGNPGPQTPTQNPATSPTLPQEATEALISAPRQAEGPSVAPRPAQAAERESKKAKHPPNPRAKPAVALLERLFSEAKGTVYRVNTADAVQVARLVAWPEATDAEIERRAHIALSDPFSGHGMTPRKLVSEWATWAQPRTRNGAAQHTPEPRVKSADVAVSIDEIEDPFAEWRDAP